MPSRHEVAPELLMVVDLAVEYEADGTILVGHRLLASFDVDDA
jgi:hypothetical protein